MHGLNSKKNNKKGRWHYICTNKGPKLFKVFVINWYLLFRLPDPPVDRLADYSNGFDNNYYDRFYKKPTPPITQKSNGQGFLQSEPLYF